MAVVAVHKVKQGVAVDGGRYWRCGEPQQRVWEQHIGQYEDENNIWDNMRMGTTYRTI